jgi:integrase/recombinase XerD
MNGITKINRDELIYKGSSGKQEFVTFEKVNAHELDQQIKHILDDQRIPAGDRLLLKRYSLNLANTLPSLHSRYAYLCQIRLLSLAVKKKFKTMTKTDLQRYFLSMESKGLKRRTISCAQAFIVAFFKWFFKLPRDAPNSECPQVISWIKIKMSQHVRQPHEVLTPEDVKKMAQVATNSRDAAIILTLFDTGARSAEFLRMKTTDIQWDTYGAHARVLTGKHEHYKKSRSLRLTYAVPALKTWFESHPYRDQNAPLWLNLGTWHGKGMQKAGLKKMIKTLAKRAGVSLERAYPHSFRHCKCYDLIRQGFTEIDLRLWFGWSRFSAMPSLYSSAYAMIDMERKILQKQGVVIDTELKKDSLEPKVCNRCQHQNSATFILCERCHNTLDLKAALDLEKERVSKDEKTAQLIPFLIEKLIQLDPKTADELKAFGETVGR